LKRPEITFLSSAFIFLGLAVSIHVLAVNKYFLFINHFNVSSLKIQFYLLALASFLAFGLSFWVRISKRNIKHKKLGRTVRYIFGITGFTLISVSMGLDLFIFNPFTAQTLLDNGKYSVVKSADSFSGGDKVSVYINKRPFLKKPVYSRYFNDLNEVRFYDDLVILSYSEYTVEDMSYKLIQEKHHFSEWDNQ